MNNINEILNKLKEIDYNKETCIAELINYNPEVDFVEPMDQMKCLRQIRALAEENNIDLEENHDELGGLGFYVRFRKVRNNNSAIINAIVKYIEQMNDNNSDSIHNIYKKVVADLNIKEEIDLYYIKKKVEKICDNKNIILDYSKYDDQIVGMPYDLEFIKKSNTLNINNNEFKINNNIAFEDEETKVEYQKYLDEINEYNRKVVNGEKPEKDLSAITDEFKQKFDFGEKSDSEINNDMLDGLKEKLDQNINSNLSYDEQIQNINKRIEDLNNEENK